jgi:hypothetical protein
MGYVKEKYTKPYFLCKDNEGKPTPYGVEGISNFRQGSIRQIIPDILESINLQNKIIFSIGFGRGEEIKYALDKGCEYVIGVDFSVDAFHIATEYIAMFYHDTFNTSFRKVSLYCMDILDYLKGEKGNNPNLVSLIDVVFMFDVLEHIPRDEAIEIFKYLKPLLNSYSVIAVNIPFYEIDDDVVKEGIKSGAGDNSDCYPETQGMHCNRYTKQSFIKFLTDVGYELVENNLSLCRKKVDV